MSNQNIALLVFAFSSEEQVKHKSFLAQGTLAKSLNVHTKKIADKSELPVYYFDETNQVGNSFGSRYSNALQSIYSKGYDAIISIGNDCPNLSVNHILQAKEVLENGGTALGPTNDGGFYLIGLPKQQFDLKRFASFSWNTKNLLDQVYADLLRNNANCTALQKLQDVNYFFDLRRIEINTISNSSLKKVIQSLLGWITINCVHRLLNKFEISQYIIFNKGSPFSFFSSTTS